MTLKEYLSRYRFLDAAINAKLKQCEALRQKAQTAGGNTGSGIHNSQPYDRVGEITARIVDLEQEINEDIDRLINIQAEISSAIHTVQELRLRTILEMRYINCMTLEEIAKHMHYSYPQIRRLHEKALRQIKMIWNDQ